MSFASGFRGTVSGSVQANYTDQPGVAVPGMLAFASDINLCDNIIVGETNGIAAGRGVTAALNTAAATNLQRPDRSLALPTVAANAAALAGIVVFDENMQTDENGVPGHAKGRFARVLRPVRAGGRIYVKAKEAIAPATATVNWVTVAGSDGLYAVGEFAPAALAGDATRGTSVAISTASFVTTAAAGELAMVEFK